MASTVCITGANRGIGLELARQFAARGASVIALVRKTSAELSSIEGVRVVEDIDVGADSSVDAIRAAVGETPVDILVNNAGILLPDSSLDGLSVENLETMRKQFEVNTLGPLRATMALSKNLHSGAKVAIVTSLMGSISDNGSGGMYGYRTSKTAVNMVGKNLAIDLQKKGVTLSLVHPGMIETDMLTSNGWRGKPVPAGAKGVIDVIDHMSDPAFENGGFYHGNYGEGIKKLPW